MANPLYFCLESLGQFAADGLGGPIIAAGAALEMVLDVCDADSEYQVRSARQEERSKSLEAQKKMAALFKAAAKTANKKNAAVQGTLASVIMALKGELERRKKEEERRKKREQRAKARRKAR